MALHVIKLISQSMRLLAAAVCILCIVLPGQAAVRKNIRKAPASPRNASVEAFIRQAYTNQANGIESMNVNKALSYTTPDFESTNKTGTLKSKTQCIMGIFQLFESAMILHATIDYHVSVQQVTVSGDTANVLVTEHLIYTIPASSTRNHVTQRSEVYETYYDTWVKTRNGWMQKESVWIGDGKQMT